MISGTPSRHFAVAVPTNAASLVPDKAKRPASAPFGSGGADWKIAVPGPR